MRSTLGLCGRSFGALKVICLGWLSGHWWCDCACGTACVLVREDHLVSGRTKSCGCKGRTDGLPTGARNSRDPRYSNWLGMVRRCSNPRYSSAHRYVGRGITVCDDWKGRWGFHNFCNDMGEKPTPAHTLDRWPDRNGNYEPSNCRWETLPEQQRNKDSVSLYSTPDGHRTLGQIADKAGIRPRTVYWRKRKGQSLEEATRPAKYRQLLDHDGLTLSIADWSERTGLPVNTIYKRLHSPEWGAEEVLAVPYRQHLSTWRRERSVIELGGSPGE
jgi:hypothetical protein